MNHKIGEIGRCMRALQKPQCEPNKTKSKQWSAIQSALFENTEEQKIGTFYVFVFVCWFSDEHLLITHIIIERVRHRIARGPTDIKYECVQAHALPPMQITMCPTKQWIFI